MLNAEDRRRRARAMVDEDDSAAPPLPTVTKARRTAPARPRQSRRPIEPATPPPASTSAAVASPTLALKFGGKVYRTLGSQGDYARDGNLFGEPDERVEDLDRERGEKRRRELELDIQRNSASKVRVVDDGEWEAPKGSRGKGGFPRATPTKRRIFDRSPSPPRRPFVLAGQRGSPPVLGLPFSAFTKPRPSSTVPASLPAPLASLLALHIMLESSLVLHLANEGAAVASSTSQTNALGEAVIRIPNLINFLELRKTIESGGKAFGEKELARLVWVWEGCGQGEGEESMASVNRDDDDDELDVGKGEAGGMGFVVTKTRAGSARSILTTYGIGIAVSLRANPQLPTFELVPHSPSRSLEKKVAPPNPGSVGRGREGMSVVALWSQGQDSRREEFGRRLRDWAERCSHDGTDVTEIPQATLPSLVAAVLCVPGTSSPTKKKPVVDVFGPAIPIALPNGQVGVMREAKSAKGVGTPEERRKAVMARLQAKADAGRSAYETSMSSLAAGGSTTKKSLKRDKDIGTSWRVEQMEMYKRNSLLSRLGNVADAVWMLFDMGNSRSKLLFEVATSISKGSKVNLSLDEAQTSLGLLCELCPDFTHVKSVDRQDWLVMKRAMGLKEVKDRVKQELGRK